ncbi:MAG TPA: hypothetical protein VHW72_16545 [Candidatus Angelobacter sp.]|nr:hypothetical protein [Candidatus Angelobacter sp.]
MKSCTISTLFLITITAWAQPKKTQPSPPADNQELKQLFAGDMHDRGSEPFEFDDKGKRLLPHKEWKDSPDMSKNDAVRQKRVREMLNEGTVRTANDFVWASFTFQHGQTPDDYLLAHVLGMVAASKGDKMGRWIAAATLDRYLQSIRQPQVFGTQFVPGAKEEMTQGEYKNGLLSNSIRAAMCVRPYEKQVEQVKQAQKHPETADFNTGQFPCP